MFDRSEGIKGLLLFLALAALGIGIAALIESKKNHEVKDGTVVKAVRQERQEAKNMRPDKKIETAYKPKNMVEACAISGFGRCDLPGCKRCFSVAASAAGNCFPTDSCPGTFCS
jgi:hypothetical protein